MALVHLTGVSATENVLVVLLGTSTCYPSPALPETTLRWTQPLGHWVGPQVHTHPVRRY